jgi:hypothetical protein
MNPKEDQLYKNFEKDIWLYLDKQLPNEKQIFWDDQLKNNHGLQEYLNNYLSISSDYKISTKVDIDDIKFDLMIEKAMSKNSFIHNVKQFFEDLFSTDSEFNFGKIAFASFLIVAAVIFSIVSDKTNPVNNFTKTINNKLLEWDPEYLETKVDKIENLLKLAKDEDYKKYYMYGLNSQNVDKNIHFIGNNINELKKDINNKEL